MAAGSDRKQSTATAIGVVVALGAVALSVFGGWGALLLRTYNSGDILVRGVVLYVDGDCYARMIRAQMVEATPGMTVVKRHEFENWPDGVAPHTTAPLDWMIAGLGGALRAAGLDSGPPGARDLAGAWIGPLLGGLAVAGLFGLWLATRVRHGWLTAAIVAAAPATVWAGAFGRPDHQALLLPLLGAAVACEMAMLAGADNGGVRRMLPWTAGAAWGLALWVSLFEPLVLFATFVCAAAAVQGWVGITRRLGGWAIAGVILLVALALEGVRVTVPGADPHFGAWASGLGELFPANLQDAARWGGWWMWVVPVVLVVRGVADARAGLRSWRTWAMLAVVVALVLGLALWQRRWNAYNVLVTACAAPYAVQILPRRWESHLAAIVAAVLLMWPAAREWEGLLWGAGESRAVALERQQDGLTLRALCEGLRDRGGGEEARGGPGGVLAPYWFSSAIAYWSGLPCVAGVSHQSLPGIVDSARFYLATDDEEAGAILRQRRVRWVVGYDPARLLAESARILGRKSSLLSMAYLMEVRPRLLPEFMRREAAIGPFTLYRVEWSGQEEP